MPKDKAETRTRIIPCARQEFLEKGFERASMRSIASCAGISAAALYCHFADKEALFDTLVSSAAQGLKQMYIDAHEEFSNLPKDAQRDHVLDYSRTPIEKMLSYIYENYESFKLIIICAEGTRYADFVHELVEIEVDYTMRYLLLTENGALSDGRLTHELMHIVTSAYFSGLFEIIEHDMSYETARKSILSLREFFATGWTTFL